MLWLKAFHVIAVVTWFAGLFLLASPLTSIMRTPMTRSASSASESWSRSLFAHHDHWRSGKSGIGRRDGGGSAPLT